jgi:hypothetical protein
MTLEYETYLGGCGRRVHHQVSLALKHYAALYDLLRGPAQQALVIEDDAGSAKVQYHQQAPAVRGRGD